MASGTRELARQLVDGSLILRSVEGELVGGTGEKHVGLGDDHRPMHGRAMEFLTGIAAVTGNVSQPNRSLSMSGGDQAGQTYWQKWLPLGFST